MTSSPMTPGSTWPREAVARFVSRLQPSQAWYDTHLPKKSAAVRQPLRITANRDRFATPTVRGKS